MLSHIFIAIILGILLGTITGLIPGLHINLLSIILVSLSTILLKYTSLLPITILILSMAITHTFLDIIPSVFLGAPDETTILTILPSHKLLLKGKGYEAIKLNLIGSLFSLIIIITLTPFFLITIKATYPILKKYIAYILITTIIFLIIKDKSTFLALITFLFSGTLGLAVLNIKTLQQPLLPLLSGLFGTSNLFLSIFQKTKIPPQKLTQINTSQKTIRKALLTSIFSGSLCSLLPGLGPAQAAIIGSSITKINTKGFLILTGSLNTINIVLSFITFYTIARARNGAILAISKIIEIFTFNHLLIFIGTTLLTGGIATTITLITAKIASKKIYKTNYKRLSILIILFISILVLIFSKPIGLLVLIVSTSIGLLPPLLNTGKNNLMGSLLIPVILYFLL